LKKLLITVAFAIGFGTMPSSWSRELVANPSADVWALAEQKLALVLAEEYRHIEEWTVTPRYGSGRSLPEDKPHEINIKQLGVRSAVQLIWIKSDASRQVHSLWFDVSGKSDTLVTLSDFAKGSSLSASDVAIEQRDIFGSTCMPLRSVEALSGSRLVNSMRAGSPLCNEAIEARPSVARGDFITVRYLSDRFSLLLKGVAQQDGNMGQRLRVLNPASRESFFAVVSGPSEVIVND
jgi:flagella basal body P-ring formation protein FlgA